MCGIFVVVSKNGSLPGAVEASIKRALASIHHRGPDASEILFSDDRRYALGHVRLSILDTHAHANQPFKSSQGSAIVYNGEIYNYLELKEQELPQTLLHTTSDTEVLINVLDKQGVNCLNSLNGMFTFCYANASQTQLLVARDRFGVKPLYVYQNQSLFIISSEIKAICAYLDDNLKPDLNTIGNYIKYGTGFDSLDTWFEGVKRVPPGHYFSIDLSSATEIKPYQRYYNYPTRTVQFTEDSVEEFIGLLNEALRIRLRSDVPIGISLSGGLDSSIIAMLCDKEDHALNAYTAYFQPVELSEFDNASLIAEQFDHKLVGVELTQDIDSIHTILSKCIYHMESGHSSPAVVPYYLLCERASQDVTVVLEGQGADELLGGYDIYSLYALQELVSQGLYKQASHYFKLIIQLYGAKFIFANLARLKFNSLYKNQFMRWGGHKILSKDLIQSENPNLFSNNNINSLNDALQHSHTNGLVNLLGYGDNISMAHSLETRLPFMDFRLVDFCMSLTSDSKIDTESGYHKHILRTSYKNDLPHSILYDRNKKGFVSPVANLIKEHRLVNRLSTDTHDLSRDLKLFKDLDDTRLNQLPPHIYYRIFSCLIWLEQFSN